VLIGCGAVSRLYYAPALRFLENSGVLRVTAVIDPVEAARERLRETFPSASPEADLSRSDAPNGSLAIIASPPRWHARQTLAALERGWNVLCEKPMAAASAEADLMIDAADSADRVLAIGHYKRFYPSSRYMKFLCGPGGRLGPLRHFSIEEGGPFTWPAASAAFFTKSETPGGVLLDIGVHVLDLLIWWLGDPDDFSYADDAMGGMEANARLELRFGTAGGRVHLSRDWATAQRYAFEFEGGTVAWTANDSAGLSLALDGAPSSLQGRLRGNDGGDEATQSQSFIAQLSHVVDAVRERIPVLVDGREGSRALRLVEACYARKQLLVQPWLEPDEAANARLWAARS
jgi:predicted dehydrogenase